MEFIMAERKAPHSLKDQPADQIRNEQRGGIDSSVDPNREGGIEKEEPYASFVEGRAPSAPMLTHVSPLRPSGVYGCSKVWGEALARHYADEHTLSVICLRIGAVKKEDRPTAPRDFSVWCSQRDIALMIGACLDAPPDLRFDVFYVTSRNRRGYRDLEHARKVLGWKPVDSADTAR